MAYVNRGLKLEVGLGRGPRLLLPVLLYHNVVPQRCGSNIELAVPTERFEAHIRWLKCLSVYRLAKTGC